MGAVSTLRLYFPISCSALPYTPETPDYSNSESNTADHADLQVDPLDKHRHSDTYVHTQTNITQRNYGVQGWSTARCSTIIGPLFTSFSATSNLYPNTPFCNEIRVAAWGPTDLWLRKSLFLFKILRHTPTHTHTHIYNPLSLSLSIYIYIYRVFPKIFTIPHGTPCIYICVCVCVYVYIYIYMLTCSVNPAWISPAPTFISAFGPALSYARSALRWWQTKFHLHEPLPTLTVTVFWVAETWSVVATTDVS